MVSKLRYFRSKRSFVKWVRSLGYGKEVIDSCWEGPGWYYHRGKGYVCKYSLARDRARGGRVGRGPWRHTHDISKVIRKLRKHVKREAKRKVREVSRRLGSKEVAAKHVIIKSVKRARRSYNLSPTVRAIADYLWRSIPKRYKEGRGRVWTYVSVIALAKAIHRYCSEKGIDWKAIDWAQGIDWRQGYRYALAEVEEILGVGKYEGLSPKDIERIEREWNRVRRDLRLPDTISPWELKALFE